MSFWSEERVESLRALTAEGTQTATEIAVILGCTRNMVIGKANRDNIQLGRTKKVRERAAQPVAEPVVVPAPVVEPSVVVRVEPKIVVTPATVVIAETAPTSVAKVAAKPAVAPIPVKIVCEPVGDISPGKTILDLEDRDCRWPVSGSNSPEFLYCGSPKVSKSYCAAHAKIGVAQRNGA